MFRNTPGLGPVGKRQDIKPSIFTDRYSGPQFKAKNTEFIRVMEQLERAINKSWVLLFYETDYGLSAEEWVIYHNLSALKQSLEMERQKNAGLEIPF
ncbi:hypothetical protein FACS189445_4700 [Spirochaetia bacterium]|nr:hypothetical protein FACS189445_4700 [Spirochaetia bacterium]